MWNSFFDEGMKLAEKAKQAAAELDQQLNESVGVAAVATDGTTTAASGEPDENIWGDDDDEEDIDVDIIVGDDDDDEPLEAVAEEDAWNEDDGDLFDETDVAEEDEVGTATAEEKQERVEEVRAPNPTDEKVTNAESYAQAEEQVSLPSSEAKEETIVAPLVVEEDGESNVQGGEEEKELPDNAAPQQNTSNDNQVSSPTQETAQPQEHESPSDETITVSTSVDQSEPTPSFDTEESSAIPKLESCDSREIQTTASNAKSLGEEELIVVDEHRREETSEIQEKSATVENKEPKQPAKPESTQKPAPNSNNNAKLIRQLQAQLAASRQQRDQDRAKFTQRLAAAQQQTKQATATADALRQEGERLAKSQSVMEGAVRSAKGELRGVQSELDEINTVCEEQKLKILSLEESISALTADLESATATASTATKLQSELSECKEESERRANTILNLEQQLKELKFMVRDVSLQLDTTQQESATETATVQKQLRQQHATAIAELQQQFEVAAREAAEREDDLRGQVDTLRTKWQDAIRRADALAVDYAAQSTPRMMQQQLESTNQQYRARAAAAAALEEELRSELEDTKKSVDSLTSEREEYKTKAIELETTCQSQTAEIVELRKNWKEQCEVAKRMEAELVALREDVTRIRLELQEAERQAETSGLRVRGEMSQSLIDSEKRYTSQLQSLETELRNERTQRRELEEELDAMKLHNAKITSTVVNGASVVAERATSKPQPKLRQTEGQAAILAGALFGFGGEDDEEDDGSDEEVDQLVDATTTNGGSSYAALEELNSRWRSAKAELDTLRKRLETSEETRQELLDRLAESRDARERLPDLEVQVTELSAENKELALEVQGLRADIIDVQELYRSQLNSLLESQAAAQQKVPPATDSDAPPLDDDSPPDVQDLQNGDS